MHRSSSVSPLKSLLETAQRRYWLVLGGLVVALAAAASQVTRSPKLYRATASLIIERPAQSDLGVPGLYREMEEAARFSATQREILASKTLLWELERRAKLGEWPEFSGLEGDDFISAVRGALDIEPKGQSAVVEVSFTGTDRERVADVVNTLCELYLNHAASSGKEEIKHNMKAIEAELPRLSGNRDAAREALEEFKAANAELTFAGRKDLLQEELKQQSRIVQDASERYDELLGKRGVIEQFLKDGGDVADLAAALSAPALSEYSRKVLELESRRADMTGREGVRRSELAALDEQIRALRGAMTRERRRAIDAVLLECDMAQGKLEQTEKRQKDLQGMAAEMDRIEARLATLNGRLDDARDLYERLLKRRDELVVLQSGSSGTDRIWVQDVASTPLRPCAPRVALILGMAAALGLMVGLGAAVLRERLDDRLRRVHDVEAALEVAPIASIPLVRSSPRSNPQVDWVVGKGVYPADEFRKLLFTMGEPGGPPGRVVTVLSAVPREGKTTVAMGLAMAAARAGYSTLLVDGDIRHPRLDELFDITGERGLIDVLSGEVEVESVVWRPPGHDLLVLPAGVPSADIEKLTRPAQISRFLEGVRGSYQVVIVDTMPMLLSADALVFARHADERLLVASAAGSRAETTRQALAQLRQAGISVRGTVLNRFVQPADRYGRYGYAYGHGAGPGARPLDANGLDGHGSRRGDRVAGREAPSRTTRPHGESRAEGVGPK